jgi:hypothetical protein
MGRAPPKSPYLHRDIVRGPGGQTFDAGKSFDQVRRADSRPQDAKSVFGPIKSKERKQVGMSVDRKSLFHGRAGQGSSAVYYGAVE